MIFPVHQRMRIGDFLLRRLSEIGTSHVFGVPGDYNMSFLEQFDGHPEITWVGTCNELNGAYAADGHSRSGKPGVLLTTYGVGCLSALNGVAGAYCEQVPLILISGSPPVHAVRNRVALHHSLLDGGYRNVHRAFTEFTAYAATISPSDAVDVIDHALVTALRTRRPVRLELPSDLTHVEITVPSAVLDLEATATDSGQSEDAADAVAEILIRARKPLLLFDLPAVRWGALKAIEEFCVALDIPFACTVPAVHQVGGEVAPFLGTLPSARPHCQEAFAEADLILACGLVQSDVTTGGFTLDFGAKNLIELHPEYVHTGGRSPETRVYYGTDITQVLTAAKHKVAESYRDRQKWWPSPSAAPRTAVSQMSPAQHADLSISERFFFDELQGFLRAGDVLIAETGTSGQNASTLELPSGVRYINQTSWGSIGYALPALLGALVAAPQERHVLCVGDGSFQVTAQELSTIIRHDLTPVIFLLNNRGYTIERSILGAENPYNDVANWSYHELPRVFGISEDKILQRVCRNRSELLAALAEAAETDLFTFIEVELDPLDMTPATMHVGEATRVFDYGVYAPANAFETTGGT